MLGLELRSRSSQPVRQRVMRVVRLAEQALDVLCERRERCAGVGVELPVLGKLCAQAFQVSVERVSWHCAV